MGRIRWYARYPENALYGMKGLTLEERGAYNTVIDLIYSHDGKLQDDDHFIAGWCSVDLRVWKRIKLSLIRAEKLFVSNGLICNDRALRGVDEALARHVASDYANDIKRAKSGSQSNRNNDVGSPPGPPPGRPPRARSELQPTLSSLKSLDPQLTVNSETLLVADQNSLPLDGDTAEPQPIDLKHVNGRSSQSLADEIFETRFWPRYPENKGGKHPAKLKFRAALKIATALDILDGMALYRTEREAEDQPQFTKHAATWLNKRGWEDQLVERERLAGIRRAIRETLAKPMPERIPT